MRMAAFSREVSSSSSNWAFFIFSVMAILSTKRAPIGKRIPNRVEQ